MDWLAPDGPIVGEVLASNETAVLFHIVRNLAGNGAVIERRRRIVAQAFHQGGELARVCDISSFEGCASGTEVHLAKTRIIRNFRSHHDEFPGDVGTQRKTVTREF